jgi:hypothetical protein
MKLPKRRKFKPREIPVAEVEAFLFLGGRKLTYWRLVAGIPRSGSLDWMIDDNALAEAVCNYLREHGIVEEAG